MRDNLRHGPSDYPFVYLAPEPRGAGKKWWESKLKHLLHRFPREVVARSVLEVVYLPYASCKYRQMPHHLPSQAYGFHLVREAMKREAVIVLMRGRKRWLAAVPELEAYGRFCQLKNPRTPAISPGNCPDFEKVVDAIAAAVKRRQA
jgi:hypothetical protein